MSKKLAIAISGAVSLGSYEAGVMYEVLETIAKHNENDTANRIEIDVITGASAGGMTAGMLVQHLLCGDGSLSDPYNNPLYKSWVEDVDIVPLLCEVKKEEQQFSLLSSSVVEEIGKKYILGKPTNPSDLHSAASSTIRVGIAMSNLNGFNYYISSKQKTQPTMNQFAYTQYKDQFVCTASRDKLGKVTLQEKVLELDEETNKESWIDTGERNWGELRDVAISSGAFPFAFQAKAIRRDRVGKFASKAGTYLYTDGGVFENEPIGLAKSLADQTEQNSNSSDRYYLGSISIRR
jgi:Patatin-like phospholipase